MSASRGPGGWRWLHPPPANGGVPPGEPRDRPGPENWDDEHDDPTAPDREDDDPD